MLSSATGLADFVGGFPKLQKLADDAEAHFATIEKYVAPILDSYVLCKHVIVKPLVDNATLIFKRLDRDASPEERAALRAHLISGFEFHDLRNEFQNASIFAELFDILGMQSVYYY